MTEPDLRFIKSDIDLSEVAPLNRRRVVAFVNAFLLKMTDYLNAFANRAERLILETERQLHAIDIKLQLLEAKLAAIPDPAPKLGDAAVKNSSAGTVKSMPSRESAQTQIVPANYDLNSEATPDTATESTQASASVEADAANVEKNVLLVKDDPAFVTYFRMLKLGVLELAVKQKMQSEGVDPAILDNPNAPSPNATRAQATASAVPPPAYGSESSSSVSSFSDTE